jgi:hypothetical protein
MYRVAIANGTGKVHRGYVLGGLLLVKLALSRFTLAFTTALGAWWAGGSGPPTAPTSRPSRPRRRTRGGRERRQRVGPATNTRKEDRPVC